MSDRAVYGHDHCGEQDVRTVGRCRSTNFVSSARSSQKKEGGKENKNNETQRMTNQSPNWRSSAQESLSLTFVGYSAVNEFMPPKKLQLRVGCGLVVIGA
jgi:predicted ATP-dependent serine protease